MASFPPDLTYLEVPAVLAHSVVGLVAIWAALGRPHWFVRIAVLGGVLALGLLIPAYVPTAIFLVQSAVVIVPLAVVRYVRACRTEGERNTTEGEGTHARPPPQFSLLDLLLATVVVAAVLGFAVSVPGDIWETWHPLTPRPKPWVLFGLQPAVFGLSTLVAAWAALGARLRWLRLIVSLAIPFSWLMAAWLALFRASGWLVADNRPKAWPAGETAQSRGLRPVIRHLTRGAAVVLSLLILLPLAVVHYVLLTPASVPESVLPEPNGYGDLVRAGEPFPNPWSFDWRTAPPTQLRTLVTQHQRFFEMARAALGGSCQVPLEYTPADRDAARWEALTQLGYAFFIEARLAEKAGKTEDAVGSYLDAIRLARAVERGGGVADSYNAAFLQDFGFYGLCGLRKKFTPKECRDVLDSLQSLEASREPVEQVLKRDTAWYDRAYGWQGRLRRQYDDWTTGRMKSSHSIFVSTVRKSQALMRLLICDLAIRIYRREHGANPARLADLVPRHLPEVPQDPFSGGPLVYRRTATAYVLYSVGGQKPPPSDWPSRDIMFDGQSDPKNPPQRANSPP